MKQLGGEFSVASGNGMLYTMTMPAYGAEQNYLSAWRTADWSRLWRVQQDVHSTVLLADGRLYAGVSGNHLVAVVATSRQTCWLLTSSRTEPLGGFVDQSPIFEHGARCAVCPFPGLADPRA